MAAVLVAFVASHLSSLVTAAAAAAAPSAATGRTWPLVFGFQLLTKSRLLSSSPGPDLNKVPPPPDPLPVPGAQPAHPGPSQRSPTGANISGFESSLFWR